MVSDSAHSFGSVGASSHVSPLENVATSVALCVTPLFPRIYCSLQSANPQTIEKALHQVTCTHLGCKSMPAVPQDAVASSGVRSIHQAWVEAAVAGRAVSRTVRPDFDHRSVPLQHLLLTSPITNFHATSALVKLVTSVFQESPVILCFHLTHLGVTALWHD